MSREQLVLMDLYDRFINVHFEKPHTPYPRSWDAVKAAPKKQRLTPAEAMAILRPHKAPSQAD